mgnify:CR=1 FL=1
MLIFFDSSSIFDSQIIEKCKNLPQKQVGIVMLFFLVQCVFSVVRYLSS